MNVFDPIPDKHVHACIYIRTVEACLFCNSLVDIDYHRFGN